MPCRHLHVLYSARWRPAEYRPHCHQPHGGQNMQWWGPGSVRSHILHLGKRESSLQKQETRAVTIKAEGHERSQCQIGEVFALLHGCSSAPSQQHCTKLSWPTFKQIQIPVFWKKYYYHGSLCRDWNVSPRLPHTKRSGYKWMLMVRSHTSTQAPPFEEVILCFDILANVLPLKCREGTCWGTGIEHMVLKSQADKSLTASDSGKRSIIAP